MKVLLNALLLLLAAGVCNSAYAFCYREAASKYGIPVLLLMAISKQESGFNPSAINVNRGDLGTDYSLMQINSRHIPDLKKRGIIKSTDDLFKPCLNVQIGAWILAKHLATCGYTWECIGSYNAGFKKTSRPRRLWYAGEIKKRMRELGADL
ncbi:lytic transglycosylase domain-containing protein [Klebsiella michiganensis]|uniref:lytic transglycosylase domain-containing protein n=1 Tax=Klebsiella michiganensis TaxID=1134687 RepID=UPI0032DADB3B